LDEREFNLLADAMLAHIEEALASHEDDLDFEIKPGGVIEIEFDNGTKIIVNRHTAARKSGSRRVRAATISSTMPGAGWEPATAPN
jgi:hypothetical protein